MGLWIGHVVGQAIDVADVNLHVDGLGTSDILDVCRTAPQAGGKWYDWVVITLSTNMIVGL